MVCFTHVIDKPVARTVFRSQIESDGHDVQIEELIPEQVLFRIDHFMFLMELRQPDQQESDQKQGSCDDQEDEKHLPAHIPGKQLADSFLRDRVAGAIGEIDDVHQGRCRSHLDHGSQGVDRDIEGGRANVQGEKAQQQQGERPGVHDQEQGQDRHDDPAADNFLVAKPFHQHAADVLENRIG